MQQLKNLHKPINYRKIVLSLLDFSIWFTFFRARHGLFANSWVCVDEWAQNRAPGLQLCLLIVDFYL